MGEFRKLFDLFKFWKRKKKISGRVFVGSSMPHGYLVASTEQPVENQVSIRSRLVRAYLISETLGLKRSARLSAQRFSDVKYPEDFNDFRDYIDAYNYVPYVARAMDVKQNLIWQRGYYLESADEESRKRIEDFLRRIEADTVIMASENKINSAILTAAATLRKEKGTVWIDKKTMMTSLPGVFAAGDFSCGCGSVVAAVASGKQAARCMDNYLRDEGGGA